MTSLVPLHHLHLDDWHPALPALKVYGWSDHRVGHSERVRRIIAAHSWEEASRLSGVALHYLRTFGAETFEPEELEAALAQPGVAHWRPLFGPAEPYRPEA